MTFRLRPAPALQLIFHRGVKVRTDSVAFADDTGLRWITADRAVLDLHNVPDLDATEPRILDLVGAGWP